jgi:hypothetical protein
MRLAVVASLVLAGVLSATLALAQNTPADLRADAVTLSESVNAFGQTVFSADGVLVNEGDGGYADVTLTARAYADDGEQVAEGYGVLVDACGAGVLPGYVMAPGHAQPFAAPLEFFSNFADAAAQVDRIEVEAAARAVDAPPLAALPDGVTQLSDQEIVRVEWLSDGGLRYAIGCPRDLFVDWQWREVTAAGRDRPIEHPDAAKVTDDLRERLGLTDPAIFENSRLSFAPEGGRMVYQDAVNQFYTAAQDGTLQRQLYTGLNDRVLQRIDWLGGNRFLATYYGAPGEPVLWFTADADGRPISPAPETNRQSQTLPGATPDGRRIVLGGAFDSGAGSGVAGYYLNVVSNGFFELLFEADIPGNSYPPPVPVLDTERDLVSRVYIVRPVDGEPMLQCFNRDEGALYDLASLPVGLTTSDRSGLWLSPDGTELALSAIGLAGGLWLIDLPALPACEAA